MATICGLRTVWKNSFGQPGSVAGLQKSVPLGKWKGGAIRLKKTRLLFAFLTVAYATSALCLVLEIIVKRF